MSARSDVTKPRAGQAEIGHQHREYCPIERVCFIFRKKSSFPKILGSRFTIRHGAPQADFTDCRCGNPKPACNDVAYEYA
jgi:hypothetical protein